MRCINCGAEFEGNVCPVCGYGNISTPNMNNQNNSGYEQGAVQGSYTNGYNNGYPIYGQNYPNNQINPGYNPVKKQKKPVNKKVIAIITGIVLAVVAVVVAIIIISNRPKTVKLNSYVKIETPDGFDGYGTVKYTIDLDQFRKDYSEIEYNDDYIDELRDKYGDYADAYVKNFPANKELASYLGGGFDKDKKLSNGDTVHFEWKIDKAELEKMFNIKLKYSDIEYTVEGLAKAEVFDPFEGIDVEFSGIDPYGKAEYKITGSEEWLSKLTYTFDKRTELKNGDIIKLSILGDKSEESILEYCITKFKKVPSDFEKAYTVSINRYVDSAAEIDQETMDAMDKQARDDFEAFVISEWAEPDLYKGMTLIGNYFLKCKFDEKVYNKVYLIHRIEVATSEYWEDTVEYYYYTEYDNVVIDKDNKCSVDLSDYSIPRYDYSDEYFKLGGYTRHGYKELSEIFDKFIASNIDKYEYEDNIKDIDNGKLLSQSTHVDTLIGKEMSFNGHRYMLVYKNSSVRWSEAKKLCENEGGHLVTITSKEEQDFLKKLCGYGNKDVFIGLYKTKDDQKKEYVNKWVTGEDCTYEFIGKDGNYTGVGHMDDPEYLWRFGDPDTCYQHYYICEWDD